MSAADNTGRRGCIFISAVGCQSELVDPLHKRGSVSLSPSLPWGGWAQSQIDGAEWQPERDGGMWGSFTPAGSREKRLREGSILYRQAEFYLLLSILTPRFILCPHTNCPNKKEKKKININKWMTEHAQSGTNPVTLSAGVIRGAERGCCLDLWVSDRKEKVCTDKLKATLARVTRPSWDSLSAGWGLAASRNWQSNSFRFHFIIITLATNSNSTTSLATSTF